MVSFHSTGYKQKYLFLVEPAADLKQKIDIEKESQIHKTGTRQFTSTGKDLKLTWSICSQDSSKRLQGDLKNKTKTKPLLESRAINSHLLCRHYFALLLARSCIL